MAWKLILITGYHGLNPQIEGLGSGLRRKSPTILESEWLLNLPSAYIHAFTFLYLQHIDSGTFGHEINHATQMK